LLVLPRGCRTAAGVEAVAEEEEEEKDRGLLIWSCEAEAEEEEEVEKEAAAWTCRWWVVVWGGKAEAAVFDEETNDVTA